MDKQTQKSKPQTVFQLRPHHLLCTLCYQGKGYDEKFVQNLNKIYTALNNAVNGETAIKIIKGYDEICVACPKKQIGLCEDDQKVMQMDQICMQVLKLKTGQKITLKSLKNKIKKWLTMENQQKICSACSWYPLNICTPVMQRLIQGEEQQ